LAEIDAAARRADQGEISPILDTSTTADELKICEMQL
jgi:hypothetical protein